jgi:hypothetical protein
MSANIRKTETIERKLRDLSLADLHIVRVEILRGAFPQTDEFELLHRSVNKETVRRIYELIEDE